MKLLTATNKTYLFTVTTLILLSLSAEPSGKTSIAEHSNFGQLLQVNSAIALTDEISVISPLIDFLEGLVEHHRGTCRNLWI